jgi:hypothetical protein
LLHGVRFLIAIVRQSRTRTWAISRIKGTPAAVLGHVEARDADSAIKEAIKKFEITDPEQQQRLVARPVK